jgi:putative ABC transport system permease protein
MPRVVRWFSVGANRLGPAGSLAAANTEHNPRRTTATSTALLIGVALVVTMSTGAATAQKSADRALDRMSPVDLKVFSLQRDPQTNQPGRINDEVTSTIGQVPGVAVAVAVPTTIAQTSLGQTVVRGIDVQQAGALLADPRIADALAAGRAVTSEDLAAHGDLTLSSGDRQVTLPTSSAGWDDPETILIPLADLARLDPEAPTTHVWAALDKDVNPALVTQDVADSLSDTSLAWESRAAQRAETQDQIDNVLTVVLGLLAVAVLIALIGVANTLSLSVVERQRELGTLRALGMTRRQLQQSLAVEGVLVAIVGTATGIVLGLAYGWAGSIIVLGPVIGTELALPWSQLVAVVIVAIAAGALASVLPARSAARTSPIAALAME